MDDISHGILIALIVTCIINLILIIKTFINTRCYNYRCNFAIIFWKWFLLGLFIIVYIVMFGVVIEDLIK